MRRFALPLLLASLLPYGNARADVYDEVEGVRSAAMGGAHRGVGSSNDTLYLNPAGMSLGRRYAVEFHYGYSPFDKLTKLNVSAVDSKSGPVAGGLGYTHTRGDAKGVDANIHRIYIAASYPISDALAFGFTTRHVRGSFVQNGVKVDLSDANGDIGLMMRLGPGLGVGLSAHNIIRPKLKKMNPLTFAVGLGFGSGAFSVAADLKIDARNTDALSYTYLAGAEYFLKNSMPIRVGYRRAPFTKKNGSSAEENVTTVGVGWINAGGALEAAFERSIERPRDWSLVTALKFFL